MSQFVLELKVLACLFTMVPASTSSLTLTLVQWGAIQCQKRIFFFFFIYINGNTERHNAPFLESASLKKRKRKSMSSDKKKEKKKTAKMSKKWNGNLYM